MALTFLIFGTVTSGCIALVLVIKDFWHAEAGAIQRRLADEFSKDKPESRSASSLFKNAGSRGGEGDATLAARLREHFEQARVPWSVQVLALATLGVALVAGTAIGWWRGPLLGAAAAALVLMAPCLWVYLRANARREKFLRQLPTVFDLMARVLRAGQSVQQAIQAVADTTEDPVAGEFARCQKQLQLGLSSQLVFQEMARRSGIVEMRLFVLAMVMQSQVGGNLAEILDRLAGTVRMRLRLRTQMRTLTAEGRLQGWTLVVLPFLLFGVLMVLNRRYAEVLLEQPRLIAAALGAMALGMLWIRRIVRLDV